MTELEMFLQPHKTFYGAESLAVLNMIRGLTMSGQMDVAECLLEIKALCDEALLPVQQEEAQKHGLDSMVNALVSQGFLTSVLTVIEDQSHLTSERVQKSFQYCLNRHTATLESELEGLSEHQKALMKQQMQFFVSKPTPSLSDRVGESVAGIIRHMS